MSNFSAQDLEQLQARGISVEKAEAQLECFKNGFPELDIVAPASTKQGILAPKRAEQEEYIAAWEQYLKEGHKILKFVPASGAASRMFKNLFQYLEDGIETPFIQEFLANKDKFAFGPQLAGKEGQEAVRYLLQDMHYGELPKGLLLFHKYRTVRVRLRWSTWWKVRNIARERVKNRLSFCILPLVTTTCRCSVSILRRTWLSSKRNMES